MNNNTIEVINWYEKCLGRKLSEAERASIREQCAISDSQIPKTKDLQDFGICLGGAKYTKNNNEV